MWNSVWEKIFRNQTWGQYPAEPLIRFVARNFYRKKRRQIKFLELGCGPGANLWFLAREGFSFVGIDGSATAVRQAKGRLSKECPGWEKFGEIIEGDVTKIHLGNDNFDAVIDNECCCCMDFDAARKVYNHSYQTLKKNGKIFVRTFTTKHLGFKTGTKISYNYFNCGNGKLAGKGPTRFTSSSDIAELLAQFSKITVQKYEITEQSKVVISEFIITASK